jgi:hypothetical protein
MCLAGSNFALHFDDGIGETPCRRGEGENDMNMKSLGIAEACCCVFPNVVQAALMPVDLSTWTSEVFVNEGPSANWTVEGAENDSVFQSVNSGPSVFYEPGTNAQGTALSGTITVETTSDDDFIGFVLGYQSGEINSPSADFWLIDWKQLNQGVAAVGMALSHVTGDMTAAPGNDFWQHVGVVNEVQRATNLGATGWLDNTTYAFDLTFTSTDIIVTVNGVEELNYSGSFTDGAFGFYNYSQTNVRYAGITEFDFCAENPDDPACTGGGGNGTVPAPATLGLLGLGLLGLGRRRHKQA